MNLRKNNGFSGIDISISLLIILIFIPTIFGVVYNIQKVNNSVNRESTALNIATDILENAKSQDSSNVKFSDIENTKFQTALKNKYTETEMKSNNEAIYSYIGTKGEHYKITLSIIYPQDSEGNPKEQDLVKQITVAVEYPVGGMETIIDDSTGETKQQTKTKTIEISTLIQSA
jgi:type II secretory pathway pseudopilin PulG